MCVDIDDGSEYDDCRCIETIGYQYTDTVWESTPEEVHEKIKDGKTFYVKHEGEKTELEAAEREGTKYVRSEPNDTKDDNLLKQDSC